MLHEKALAIAQASSNASKISDFSGLWRNQMESTMDLRVQGKDVTGIYTSASSAVGGPVAGTLKGYCAGDLLSFLVLWPGGSQTAWVGQMVGEEANPVIRTLWHLVTEVPNEDEPTELWTSTFAGADEFTRPR